MSGDGSAGAPATVDSRVGPSLLILMIAILGEGSRNARIASSDVCHIERGENVPSLTVILKISLALEILPGDLLSDFTISRMKKLRLDE